MSTAPARTNVPQRWKVQSVTLSNLTLAQHLHINTMVHPRLMSYMSIFQHQYLHCPHIYRGNMLIALRTPCVSMIRDKQLRELTEAYNDPVVIQAAIDGCMSAIIA